jgi:hypothetical protein
VGAPPPGAMPPIASSAQAQLGQRYAFIEGRQRARVRRAPGWQEEVWHEANPADPANVNAQSGDLITMPASSGPTQIPYVIFQIDVPTDNTLVLYTATARIYGCALLYLHSPTWQDEYGLSTQMGFNSMWGTGKIDSNHTATPGYRYGLSFNMFNTDGPGWPIPMSGMQYVYPKKTAGVFELNLVWQTGVCPAGTSWLWDIRIGATVLP